MSIMTRADWEGSMVMGSVDVWTVCVGPALGDECVDGWVRVKPFLEECDQKFEGEPIKAFRWALRGIVEDIDASVDVLAIKVGSWSTFVENEDQYLIST
jgi:hypothetical protein